MAQTMHCENPQHTEPTEGFVLLQFLGSPDTQVTCISCFPEWCWSFLEKLPDFDDRIKTYAGMVIAQYQEEKAAARKAARGGKSKADGQAEDTAGISGGENAPTDG